MRSLTLALNRKRIRHALQLARMVEHVRGRIRSPERRSALIAFRHRGAFTGQASGALIALVENIRSQLA